MIDIITLKNKNEIDEFSFNNQNQFTKLILNVWYDAKVIIAKFKNLRFSKKNNNVNNYLKQFSF